MPCVNQRSEEYLRPISKRLGTDSASVVILAEELHGMVLVTGSSFVWDGMNFLPWRNVSRNGRGDHCL